jgi:hypothetical protein
MTKFNAVKQLKPDFLGVMEHKAEVGQLKQELWEVLEHKAEALERRGNDILITSVWLECAALVFAEVCDATGINKELAIKILLPYWDAPTKPINPFAAAAMPVPTRWQLKLVKPSEGDLD